MPLGSVAVALVASLARRFERREGKVCMRRRARFLSLLGVTVIVATAVSVFSAVRPAHADPVSGAIFTTDVNGNEVNLNQYAAKTDVYLNGGPGVNAPPGAAGLPDGTYYFQVTDPAGKKLLSTDAIQCREVGVLNGVFTGPTGPCPHNAGGTTPFNGTTVQLFPFNDTPNNGGVYKVWVTSITNFNEAGCVHLVFGFCPADSKTDNFKVKQSIVVEIDTEFFDNAGNPIDGLMVNWTDTLGAHNNKWSEWAPQVLAYNQAHVEGVETGTHQITVANQVALQAGDPSCTVTEIDTQFPGQPTVQVLSGPGTVSVTIPNNAYNNKSDQSYFINVYCA